MQSRALALNCLTTHYTDLWSDCWNPTFQQDTWSKPNDPRLDPHFFRNLTPNGSATVPSAPTTPAAKPSSKLTYSPQWHWG